MHKKGFTLIELLLVIGIIAILAAIVIVAINPTKQLTDAEDARRTAYAREIKSAISQYEIDNSNPPDGITSTAQNICSYNASDTGSCLPLDVLVSGGYLVTLEQDVRETDANNLGYTLLQDSGGFYAVSSTYLGVSGAGGGGGASSSAAATACVDGATYPISVGTQPNHTMAEIGTNLYVPNFGSNTVSVVSLTSDSETSTFSTAPDVTDLYAIVAKGNGTGVYVIGGNDIGEYDVTSGTLIDTVGISGTNWAEIINGHLYTWSASLNGVVAIDITDNSLTTSFSAASSSYAIQSGTGLYVTSDNLGFGFEPALIAIDTSLATPTSSTISVGGITNAGGATLIGSTLWVPDADSNDIYPVNTSNHTVGTAVDTGLDDMTYGTAIGDIVYVPGDGGFVSIDTSDSNAVTLTPTGTTHYSIQSSGTRIFIATQTSIYSYDVSDLSSATTYPGNNTFDVHVSSSGKVYMPGSNLQVSEEDGTQCT